MITANEIEHLFRTNYRAMLILANRLIHDEETARDIVHDVFISLLTDCPDSVSSAYLLNGVRYACLNHIRNLSVRQRLNNLYSLELKDIESENWPDDEDIARLNDIISEALSEQSREVLRLRFTQRLKYKEIADKLCISEVAVYKHLRHAIDILRQKFNKYER